MKGKGSVIILILGLAFFGAALWAQSNYSVVQGPAEMYFGHVSLTDIRNDGKDAVVFRDGRENPELAVLNTPLGPGDTIRTSAERRLEIQFDNATIMRLDTDTELKIETILAESLSSSSQKVTNFVLVRGRVYVMYKEYSSKEMFQVLTPRAAVKFKHATVASVAATNEGTTDVQVEYGKCYVLFGPDSDNLTERTVDKGKSATISKDDRVVLGALTMDGAFDAWNKSINKNFEDLHEGKTPIPKPVQRLPKAVFYFAQTFGNPYGEWIYDDYFGYVWRPFYNDTYPWGTWQPYFYGHWTSFGGQMYWIPDEPWGWVPYHLGVWQWDEKKGWFWIPGSAFAPAWVDWAFFFGTDYAWRPWSMWDWYGLSDYGWGGMDGYYYSPFYSWQYDGRGFAGGVYQPLSGDNTKGILTKVTKDQLKKPGRPTFTMPKEFAKVLKALSKGLQSKDSRLIASLQALRKQTVVLSAKDLGVARVSERAVRFEDFLKRITPQLPKDPQKAAALLKPESSLSSSFSAVRTLERVVRGSAGAPSSSAGRSSISLTGSRKLPAALNVMISRPTSRVLDWNPDVRIGQRLGVTIQYSSRTNQVYCPELRISSVNAGLISNPIRPWSRLGGASSDGSMSAPSGSYGLSGGGSASSGGSMSAGSGSSSSGSSSGTTSTGGGGHIR